MIRPNFCIETIRFYEKAIQTHQDDREGFDGFIDIGAWDSENGMINGSIDRMIYLE